MRALKLVSALIAMGLVLGALASPSWGQRTTGQRAPTVKVYVISGSNPTSYVAPRIRLSENAYVFVVEKDMDGLIRVLHPDLPETSGKTSASNALRLPDFFIGFGASGMPSRQYVISQGTVIALASRVPFNLDVISTGGDWNTGAIRRVIERRTPQSAMDALASYIGAKGEPIGRDFMLFYDVESGYLHEYSR